MTWLENNKIVKFFDQDFIDVLLKAKLNIEILNKKDLIPKMTILGVKHYLLLVLFSNSHFNINSSEIQLGEPLSATSTVQEFPNKKQRLTIFIV